MSWQTGLGSGDAASAVESSGFTVLSIKNKGEVLAPKGTKPTSVAVSANPEPSNRSRASFRAKGAAMKVYSLMSCGRFQTMSNSSRARLEDAPCQAQSITQTK